MNSASLRPATFLVRASPYASACCSGTVSLLVLPACKALSITLPRSVARNSLSMWATVYALLLICAILSAMPSLVSDGRELLETNVLKAWEKGPDILGSMART